MTINVGIIDQQVDGFLTRHREAIEAALGTKKDEPRLKSAAFVVLTLKIVFDLDDQEALGCLTEGTNDFGIDAVRVGTPVNGEFVVTLVSGKYKQNADGGAAFPQGAIEKLILAVQTLFNPRKKLSTNDDLAAQIAEIRSIADEGNLPIVRCIACSNGAKWTKQAEQQIAAADFGSQVTFEHVNHDNLVLLLSASKPVDDTIRLSGRAVVDPFDYRRVLVGKVSVQHIAELFNRHGDRLLERNVRRYLGWESNRVNSRIKSTLTDTSDQANFYFYNNGVTALCTQFKHNALKGEDWDVQVRGLQIINGGQTCKTIQMVLQEDEAAAQQAFVLFRLYELSEKDDDLVREITLSTNSQSPVELRDLRSNDGLQKRLATSIDSLGFSYKRQRAEGASKPTDITSATAAEAILAVWRKRPQQARFSAAHHFGKLYDTIFLPELNGAQVVIAVLIYRFAENRRKRPPEGSPDLVRYASAFAAMLIGKYLLDDLGIELHELNHKNFVAAQSKFESNASRYFERAIDELEPAVKKVLGAETSSLQRLSATFRRGDLLAELDPDEVISRVQVANSTGVPKTRPDVRRPAPAEAKSKVTNGGSSRVAPKKKK